MHRLFGDLLPERLAGRRTKVCFDEAFWGPGSRSFAATWDGTGVDAGVVDVERLRRLWAEPLPDSHTYLLIQAAWLAARSESRKNGSLAARPVVSASKRT
jgi:hypothetical protein